MRNSMMTAATLAAAILGGGVAQAADLTFWSWRQEDKAAYAEIIADFEAAHPGTTVTFEAFEATSYAAVLSTALAGGGGPDIAQVRAYGAMEAIASPGYLRPIGDGEISALDAFPEAAIQAETVRSDGNLYAVPFASQTLVIYYNTDIFAENGLAPPEDWTGFLATLGALKDAGVIPMANGTATAWQNEILVGTVVPSFYGAQFEADIVAGTATFEDDALRRRPGEAAGDPGLSADRLYRHRLWQRPAALPHRTGRHVRRRVLGDRQFPSPEPGSELRHHAEPGARPPASRGWSRPSSTAATPSTPTPRTRKRPWPSCAMRPRSRSATSWCPCWATCRLMPWRGSFDDPLLSKVAAFNQSFRLLSDAGAFPL